MAEFELDEERALKAYESLVKYIAISPRSEHECKEKLYEKGYHKNEVEYAIDRAKKYRYINDFSRSWRGGARLFRNFFDVYRKFSQNKKHRSFLW